MPTLRPFAAIRATRDKVHLVASRSYVTYSTKDLRDKLKGNPYTYLHVIHPDLGSRAIHKTQGEERMKLVRDRYDQFKTEGIFFREEKPFYYIYRQIKNGHAFTGIMATVAVQDYLDGRIRIHEHTLSSRESTFTSYLDRTGLNAEPVLLFHPEQAALDSFIIQSTEERPEYDFSTTNKVRHQLWIIRDEDDINFITGIYSNMAHVYIADGHHRCASSAALCEKWRQSGRITSKNHPAEFFLAYLLSASTMRIYEFNRLVRDLGQLTPEEFIERLRVSFEIIPSSTPVQPLAKGMFGMYLGTSWYTLTLRKPSPLLDTDILYQTILHPMLGIGDQKKDTRIRYMEGPRGISALETEVNKKRSAAAFTLCPVNPAELRAVADAGECMPPKSTWIEPKLRSGLLIHELFTPIQQNLMQVRQMVPSHVTIVAVSKKKSAEEIQEVFHLGQRDFGENYVQELIEKQPLLSSGIRWHFIGHLQSNKVKLIAPFVHMIHGVDSLSLLAEINKQAEKCGRVIPCLLQVHIAEEESKFGIPADDLEPFLDEASRMTLPNVRINGLMGMASFTENQQQVRGEFNLLRILRDKMQSHHPSFTLSELSMGMTGDWPLAVEEGSSMIRVGSAIFGERT